MATVKRIGPGSAFKVGLVLYGLLGLIGGVLCSVVALAAPSAHAHLPFGGPIGLFALILCPLIYGILGGIATLIGALLYNLASHWVGGLQVDWQ